MEKEEERNKDGVTSNRGEGEEKFRLSQGKDKERKEETVILEWQA